MIFKAPSKLNLAVTVKQHSPVCSGSCLSQLRGLTPYPAVSGTKSHPPAVPVRMLGSQWSSFSPKGAANIIPALCIKGFPVCSKLILQNCSVGFIATATSFPQFSLKFVILAICFESIPCTLQAAH